MSYLRNKKLDSSYIINLSYVDLMALLEETNRPPGGLINIMKIASLCNIRKENNVIDIGCNTGFVALQLSRLTKCKIIGVDVNDNMISSAKKKLMQLIHRNNIQFKVADASNLPFSDNVFDVAICGGSLAFMSNQKKVIHEMIRVTKERGFISSLDFFYKKPPSLKLLNKLKEVLGFAVPIWNSDYWYELFNIKNLELVLFEKEDAIYVKNNNQIKEYVKNLTLRNKNLFTISGLKACEEKMLKIFSIFNEINKYLGVVKIIGQKTEPNPEPILFCCRN